MAILTIGRVGMDVEISHPHAFTESRTMDGGRQMLIKGFLKSDLIAKTIALRTELMEQQGQLIALTYSLDPTWNGFYILTDTRVESIPVSYRGAGFYQFEALVLRIGSDSRTELQSLLSGAGVTNSHSLGGQLWHATPPLALAYDAGTTTPTEHTRTSEDGAMGVYLGVSVNQDPTWSISASNYYKAAVKVTTQSRVRSGLDTKSDPADWELQNGLIRIRPQTYQSVSNGFFDFQFYSGSVWSQAITFKIVFSNTTDIPKWHYVSIIRNTPEMATVRIIRDAETSPPSAYRHVLDFTLRRGAPFVSCHYTFKSPTSALHAVARTTADAATAGTGHIRDNGVIDGHRWILGSPRGITNDLTNGKIILSVASTTFPFFIGAALNDAASGSGSGPTDVTNQYIGWCSETVRAVRR